MKEKSVADQDIKAVLFDIDGTLVTTGGAGAVAWSRGFEEIYGTAFDIREVTENGMTDAEVGRVALHHFLGRDPEPPELARALRKYIKYLPDAVAESDDYTVMPGVHGLLDRLVDAGLFLGLSTGNIEPAAHVKLARAKINHFFSFGGFGSDSNNRIELTRRGIERGVFISGGVLKRDECIAVGDTPRDVAAAQGAGIRVVSVATGNYSADELSEAKPDYLLETLEQGFPI